MKILSKFLIVVLLFSASLLLLFPFFPNKQVTERMRGGSSDDVIKSTQISQVITKIESDYAGKDNLRVTQSPVYTYYMYGYQQVIMEYNLPVVNFSQSTFNTHFLNTYGTTISGTCTIVAATEIINYYGTVKNDIQVYNRSVRSPGLLNYVYSIGNQPEDVFSAIFRMSRNNLYITNTSGTLNTVHDNILQYSFNMFDSNNTIANTYTLVDNIKSETKNGRPVMFNVSNHTMVARGYVSFLVSYTETTGILWWKKTNHYYNQVDYIIVDHGWSSSLYGYYPASQLPNQNFLYNAQLITEVI
ncbi:MAG: hypothetical protein Q7I99_05485 [Acholeplasmataceae bacterium]|nr:hypothetical protein [Acholeplasmataceae bacterium]